MSNPILDDHKLWELWLPVLTEENWIPHSAILRDYYEERGTPIEDIVDWLELIISLRSNNKQLFINMFNEWIDAHTR